MQSKLVLIDRQALQAELRQVFDARTARTLLSVLDKVAAQARAAGVTREDFGELGQIVAELAEAQRRTEQRVEELAEAQRRTEQRVAELAEAQRRSEERLSGVEERLSRLEEAVVALAEAQRRTEQRLEELIGSHQRLVDKVARIDGRTLEQAYREKAGAYFGSLLRRLQVVLPHTLEDVLEARLSPEGFRDVLLLDLLVSGQPRQLTQVSEVWLAVEVSSVVDEGDVARARQRAELLRQAGYRAVPVVAGERATLAAEDEARQHKVVVLQDGRSFLWDEALAAWGA